MTNESLVPLSVLALDLFATADQLAAQHGDQTLVDDLGRVCVDRDTARDLITQHRAQLQAQADLDAAQAEQQRVEAERLAAQYAANDRARQARAQRQRELLRDDPSLSALEVMLALDNDPDERTPAGRRFDELYQAERQGNLGHMYRFHPDKET
jgi:hypothetical protein